MICRSRAVLFGATLLTFSMQALAADRRPAERPGGSLPQSAPAVFTTQLLATGGLANDHFGRAIDVSADRALVSAWDEELRGRVAAYAQDAGGWCEEASLKAADAAEGDEFGTAVAVDGDTALIGAPRADIDGHANQGAAYVFEHADGDWTQVAKLTALAGNAMDSFGASAAVQGDIAVVGAATAERDSAEAVGAVYVYSRSGGSWTQSAVIQAADWAPAAYFGIAVALSGQSLIVGSPGGTGHSGNGPSAAYVYTQDGTGWQEQAKLIAHVADPMETIGSSVDLDGDRAVVSGRSSAFVFARARGRWRQEARLTDPAGGEWLVNAVSLCGDRVFVATVNQTIDGRAGQGAVHVFQRSGNGWQFLETLTAGDGDIGDGFGTSVSAQGDYALAGAASDDNVNGIDAGSAYVYRLP